MGISSSSPIGPFKDNMNAYIENALIMYKKASQNVSQNIEQIVPTITKNITTETKQETKTETETKVVSPIIVEDNPSTIFNKFEKDLDYLYKGCFLDDPSNPSMEKYLGQISNSLECINLGVKNKFKYVGIQQGDKCYASNTLPITSEANRIENCNVGCDDINTGNCGGFFYNQVYDINLLLNNNLNETKPKTKVEVESKETFENFINLDSELYNISKGVDNINCNCITPINSYILFIWIVILIILIYLLFEYLLKKI